MVLTPAAATLFNVMLAAAAGAAIVTGMSGGKLGDIVKSGAIAAMTALAFYEIGGATQAFANTKGLGAGLAFNAAGHAGVGCLSAIASGGKCGPGALSGAAGSVASPLVDGIFPNASTDFGQGLGGAAVSGAIAGLASLAGGGKFEDGAVTAAFGYMFNWIRHVDGLPIQRGSSARPYFDTTIIDRVVGFFRDLRELGIPIELTSGFRPTDIQAQYTGNEVGGTKPGNSLHEAGLAFDINWDSGHFNAAQRQQILDVASEYGLRWGGTFSTPDARHFYFDPFKTLAERQNYIALQQGLYRGATTGR